VQQDATPTRRSVVTVGAAAALGVAGAAGLAGCGGSSSGSTTGTSSAATGGSAAAPLAKLSEVPVGGAVKVSAASGEVIVAQPEAGKVVAFSAVCTHQGCKVAPVGKELDCPCHGSKFDAFTGAVLRGPAASPLASVPVKVDGGNVVAG
jgi:Rieske Fe-S protein